MKHTQQRQLTPEFGSVEPQHTRTVGIGERRLGRIQFAAYAFVLLELLGCDPRPIVLGRGDVDAGTENGTNRRAESEHESSAASVTSSGELTSSHDDGLHGSGSSAPISSSVDDGASTSDVCRDAYTRCMEEASGTMCQTLLINCRVALPDGGPACSDVYPQCIALGYSVEDCQRAAETCEEGGEFVIVPPASSTL